MNWYVRRTAVDGNNENVGLFQFIASYVLDDSCHSKSRSSQVITVLEADWEVLSTKSRLLVRSVNWQVQYVQTLKKPQADVMWSDTKGPFIATQLHSWVSCIGEVSIVTSMQLNSTQLDVELWTRSQGEQLSSISSERRDPVDSVCRWQLSCVGEGVYSDATQLNSTRRWVELSCVATNGPLVILGLNSSSINLSINLFISGIMAQKHNKQIDKEATVVPVHCSLPALVHWDRWTKKLR